MPRHSAYIHRQTLTPVHEEPGWCSEWLDDFDIFESIPPQQNSDQKEGEESHKEVSF